MPPPEPPGIEVRPHPTRGRGLYATRPFTPYEPIHGFTPLLSLPTLAHLSSVCTHCLRPGQPRACTRCRAAFYCDAACQTADWAVAHGKECKALRGIAKDAGALPTPVRALVQLLSRPDAAAQVSGLEGHVQARRRRPDWEDLGMMAMAACAFAGKRQGEGERQAVELLCKIQTNAFQRHDEDSGNQVGIFLEPTLAMTNHSCVPNALVQFVGRNAILRAEAPIKAGDEIEISYTDYTIPLSRRQKALSQYNFECSCPRCKDDLNVYQVCASSPNLDLNRLSLASDLSKLRGHPAVTDPKKRSSAREHGEKIASLVDPSVPMHASLVERRKILQEQYRQCEPLVADGLWAVYPLPQVLNEIAIYYAEAGNFPLALVTACLLATACDPYRYAAPFHPGRVKNLFMIAKLLSNTAADAAAERALSKAIAAGADWADLDQRARDVLQDIDQVSLCQMLLILSLREMSPGRGAAREQTAAVQKMLDDIESLPGREKEAMLINSWRQDPSSAQSQAFFEYALVQQVQTLASLAPTALILDFQEG